jgi:hypothetical protein
VPVRKATLIHETLFHSTGDDEEIYIAAQVIAGLYHDLIQLALG